MARIIREAVTKMDTMTRELVDFSRGKTELHLQLVHVSDLIEGLQPEFAKCRPYIDVQTELVFQGQLQVDRHRLLRVFSNLIRNAREAMNTQPGSRLRFAAKQLDSVVRFEISDNGCGIPRELLPRIFEPFVTHGKANGTGLGLAISKAVVEAHHGSIAVSTSHTGTTFQIDLPLPR
jgi:signal transduction histidine kinase